MNKKKIITTAIIIILLILTPIIINNYGLEKPLSLSTITTISGGITGNVVAPQKTLNAGDIEVYPNRIIINLANASISRYAPTGSMNPTLNENSKGIKIPVTNKEQLHVGDIITYEDENEELVIHRIIAKGFDERGEFYITKGDNNLVSDGKIRYEQIRYKLVALVY